MQILTNKWPEDMLLDYTHVTMKCISPEKGEILLLNKKYVVMQKTYYLFIFMFPSK